MRVTRHRQTYTTNRNARTTAKNEQPSNHIHTMPIASTHATNPHKHPWKHPCNSHLSFRHLARLPRGSFDLHPCEACVRPYDILLLPWFIAHRGFCWSKQVVLIGDSVHANAVLAPGVSLEADIKRDIEDQQARVISCLLCKIEQRATGKRV